MLHVRKRSKADRNAKMRSGSIGGSPCHNPVLHSPWPRNKARPYSLHCLLELQSARVDLHHGGMISPQSLEFKASCFCASYELTDPCEICPAWAVPAAEHGLEAPSLRKTCRMPSEIFWPDYWKDLCSVLLCVCSTSRSDRCALLVAGRTVHRDEMMSPLRSALHNRRRRPTINHPVPVFSHADRIYERNLG